MLRPYRHDDLEGVLDVWYRASVIAHWFLSEEFLETERRLIAEDWLPASETTVAEADGRVVGFLSLVGIEVGGIFVDPDCQGRGVGRALMDHARLARPHLELGVFEDNSQVAVSTTRTDSSRLAEEFMRNPDGTNSVYASTDLNRMDRLVVVADRVG